LVKLSCSSQRCYSPPSSPIFVANLYRPGWRGDASLLPLPSTGRGPGCGVRFIRSASQITASQNSWQRQHPAGALSLFPSFVADLCRKSLSASANAEELPNNCNPMVRSWVKVLTKPSSRQSLRRRGVIQLLTSAATTLTAPAGPAELDPQRSQGHIVIARPTGEWDYSRDW
jgi:hypothetical protein